MPKTMWEWLDINSTTDKNLIKKAYAEQSKKYHPEEFPEEAMQLREAYKKAMALASGHRNNAEETAEFSFPKEQQKTPDSPRRTQNSRNEHQYNFSNKAAEGSDTPDDTRKSYHYMPGTAASDAEDSDAPDDTRKSYHYMPKATASDGKVSETSETSKNSENRNAYSYRQFEPDKAKRIQKLSEQLVFVYENPDYRRIPKIWGMVFELHPDKEDFKDPLVTAELISVLEQMSLEKPVWRILKRKLFQYSNNSAEWLHLRNRLEEARCAVTPQKLSLNNWWNSYKSRDASAMQSRAATELYGAGNKISRRYKIRSFLFLGLILTPFVTTLLYGAIFAGKQEQQREKQHKQEVIDGWEKELRRQQEEGTQQEIPPWLVLQELFKKQYTKDMPCDTDMNDDQIDEHVYYDADAGCFMVEFYDSDAEAYQLYGTVDQYLEANPDLYHVGINAYFSSYAAAPGQSEE